MRGRVQYKRTILFRVFVVMCRESSNGLRRCGYWIGGVHIRLHICAVGIWQMVVIIRRLGLWRVLEKRRRVRECLCDVIRWFGIGDFVVPKLYCVRLSLDLLRRFCVWMGWFGIVPPLVLWTIFCELRVPGIHTLVIGVCEFVALHELEMKLAWIGDRRWCGSGQCW